MATATGRLSSKMKSLWATPLPLVMSLLVGVVSAAPNMFCLLPIEEGQALDASEVWKQLESSTPEESDDKAASALGISSRDQIMMHLVDSKAAAECAGAPRISPWDAARQGIDYAEHEVKERDIDRNDVSRMRDKTTGEVDRIKHQSKEESWREARKDGEPWAKHAKKKADKTMHDWAKSASARERNEDHSYEPVKHEGEPCFEACDKRSGKCSTGFCGGGFCCQRWHPENGCPVGLDGGCRDQHCCVELPEARVEEQAEECQAAPGSFCLYSLVQSLEHNMTETMVCAMQRTIIECPAGFYCPGKNATPHACRKGRRCAGSNAQEEPCPAGSFCRVSILQEPCPRAKNCSENTTQPDHCPAGYYCVNGISHICPKGHMCPIGTVSPTACAWLADCPEGSTSAGWVSLLQAFVLGVLPTWTVAVSFLPECLSNRGCVKRRIAPTVLVLAFCVVWAIHLNVLPFFVRIFTNSKDPSAWGLKQMFGTVPHGTALVFLTCLTIFLYYGLRVTGAVEDQRVRGILDLVIAGVFLLGFALYLEEYRMILLVGTLGLLMKVILSFIEHEGSLESRLLLLVFSYLILVTESICLGHGSVAVFFLAVLGLCSLRQYLRTHGEKILCRSRFARRLVQACKALAAWGRFGGTGTPTDVRTVNAVLTAARESFVEQVATDARQLDLPVEESRLHHHHHHHHHRSSCSSESESDTDGATNANGGGGGDDDDDEHSLQKLRPGVSFDSGNSSSSTSRPQPGLPHGVSFDLNEVGYRLENGRHLLQHLSFSVPGGASAAIMGASGAGKTTLLSVLSGRCGEGRLVGDLRIDGAHMSAWQMAALRPVMGYVPQDDVMHSYLSVRENLHYQAELRLRPALKLSKAAASLHLKNSVDRTLAGLGLSHVQHRLGISGLSGGQRKRASIGMELVVSPRILMLDEPSSGLDASTSHRILSMVLRQSNSEACTTFATIHQPRWNTLCLFDVLVLLAPGGHLVYAGPVSAVKAYFTVVPKVAFPVGENPADIIIDASCFDSARNMAVEGIWKSPPQCLRVLLIPPPGMEDEESKEPWQLREFGRMLAEMWRECSSKGFLFTPPTSPNSSSKYNNSSSKAAVGTSSASLDATSVAGTEGDIEMAALENLSRPMNSQDVEADNSFSMSPPRRALFSFFRNSFPYRHAEVVRELPGSVNCSSAGSTPLLAEAQQRLEALHWAQQVWAQTSRALLGLSRALSPAVFANLALLVVAVVALSFAFPTFGFRHIFQRNSLALMLVCLAQTVPAMRVFGGEEADVAKREGCVQSPRQVLFGFIGKDLASLVELTIAAGVFGCFYCALVESNLSQGDALSIGFGLLYSVWGICHLLSILLPLNVAILAGVIGSFLSFIFSGIQPEISVFKKILGGEGAILLLVSPIRWALTLFAYRHVTGGGNNYGEPSVHDYAAGQFQKRGFDLKWLPLHCPDHRGGVVSRWFSANGWGCHTAHLLMLGIIFRALAASALMLGSSRQASGGKLSMGASSVLGNLLLRDALGVFVFFAAMVSFEILGEAA